MRAVLLGTIAIGASLSGCILDDLLGGCDPPPWLARWDQPGLLQALPADGPFAGHTIASQLRPTLLVFSDPGLDERYGGANYSLVSVSFASMPGTNRFNQGEIYLSHTGNASMQVLDDVDDDQARQAFLRFLVNATLLDPPAREEAAEAFVANRTLAGRVYSSEWARDGSEPSEEDFRDVLVLHADLSGPWNLSALFGSMGTNASSSRMGTDTTWRAGEWTFRLDLLERSAERDFGSARGRLVLDLHGGAVYEVDSDTKPPQEFMRDMLGQTLDALDMPRPPPMETLEFSSRVRC